MYLLNSVTLDKHVSTYSLDFLMSEVELITWVLRGVECENTREILTMALETADNGHNQL